MCVTFGAAACVPVSFVVRSIPGALGWHAVLVSGAPVPVVESQTHSPAGGGAGRGAGAGGRGGGGGGGTRVTASARASVQTSGAKRIALAAVFDCSSVRAYRDRVS
eukprot:COSAG02_NODE_4666_length_5113_cov_2.619541_1_plen_106_part_00